MNFVIRTNSWSWNWRRIFFTLFLLKKDSPIVFNVEKKWKKPRPQNSDNSFSAEASALILPPSCRSSDKKNMTQKSHMSPEKRIQYLINAMFLCLGILLLWYWLQKAEFQEKISWPAKIRGKRWWTSGIVPHASWWWLEYYINIQTF